MAARSNIAGRNRCRADRWRYSRPACSDISTSVPRSREYDVGGDREPEGVIADNLYLDEHANDRKDHQHERNHKSETTNPKFTAHISLRCDETQKTLLGRLQPSTCEILSQAQRPRLRYVAREAYFLTRNSRALVVLERKIVTLDWTINAVCYPDVRLNPLCDGA